MRYWMMKSEPQVFSIDDLARAGTTAWEGVRNYQVRNMMRDEMAVGDRVLFYHSSATPPGVAGLARICGPARPDPASWDPSSPYHDPKCVPGDPRWLLVDLAYEATFPALVPLDALRADPALDGLLVTRKGQRLSVMPVTEAHFAHIVALGQAAPAASV